MFGMLWTSTLTIFGEYNSSTACTFFPALQSSTRRFPISEVVGMGDPFGLSLTRDVTEIARENANRCAKIGTLNLEQHLSARESCISHASNRICSKDHVSCRGNRPSVH